MSQNQMCSICQQQPEDLLILSCQHNLCVHCATQVFALNSQQNVFTCEICLSETELDEETISFLLSLTKREEQPKMQIKERPPKSSSKKRERNERQERGQKHGKNMCQIHKQVSLYFCFDCETSKICSECILTTKHSKHRVYTLKKAMSLMQKKVSDQIKAKQSLKEQLYCERSKYIQTKQHMKTSIEGYKEEIKDVFDEIVRAVSDKFAQTCSQMEQGIRKKQQLIDGCILQINQKLEMLEETLNFERKILKSKEEKDAMKYFQQIHPNNNDLFCPKLPSELPEINLTLMNHETAIYEVKKVLEKIGWNRSQSHNGHNGHNVQYQYSSNKQVHHEQESLPISIIERQYYHDQAPKTVLKQSQHVSNSRSHLPKSSNRKLELSRSLDNATNIINKLQQRSRKV